MEEPNTQNYINKLLVYVKEMFAAKKEKSMHTTEWSSRSVNRFHQKLCHIHNTKVHKVYKVYNYLIMISVSFLHREPVYICDFRGILWSFLVSKLSCLHFALLTKKYCADSRGKKQPLT